MRSLVYLNFKLPHLIPRNNSRLILSTLMPTRCICTKLDRGLTDKKSARVLHVNSKQVLLFGPSNKVHLNAMLLTSIPNMSDDKANKTNEGSNAGDEPKKQKKQSKFKQLYTQYGPLFIVVHLTTVVMWIYGFFLISKQGYDITQILTLFEKVNLMSAETVKSVHFKIDNYKMESGWITGEGIKHFATAYMIYKVIAPFRYVVSIAIVRALVKTLRQRGIMKS